MSTTVLSCPKQRREAAGCAGRNDGSTWQLTGLVSQFVFNIVPHPSDPNTVLAATDSSLMLTKDGGVTWNAVFPTRDRFAQALFFLPNGTAFAAFTFTSDVFIGKYSPGGEQLIFATYFGGQGNEMVKGIAVDKSGNVAVVGTTFSPGFPTTPNGLFRPRRIPAIRRSSRW